MRRVAEFLDDPGTTENLAVCLFRPFSNFWLENAKLNSAGIPSQNDQKLKLKERGGGRGL